MTPSMPAIHAPVRHLLAHGPSPDHPLQSLMPSVQRQLHALLSTTRLLSPLSLLLLPSVHFIGLPSVVSQSINSSYRLADVDGAVSKLKFSAFWLVPYHPRSHYPVAP